MPKITIVNEKREIDVAAGTVLRRALLDAGIETHAVLGPAFGLLDKPVKYLNCHGLGMCGTCKVLVKKGMENLSSKSLLETVNFTLHPVTSFAVIGHEDEMRLSCQTIVEGDVTIETRPAFNISGENFWAKPYPNK